MTIKWGTKKNGYAVGYEVQGFGTVTSATSSVNVVIDVYIQRDHSLSDSSNVLEWKGNWFTDSSQSNFNLSGIGELLFKTLTFSVNLTYAATQTKTFKLNLLNIGSTTADLTVSGSVTIPARPYAVPAAPTAFSATRISDAQINLAWTNTSPGSSSAPYQGLYIWRYDGVVNLWQLIASLGSTTTSYQDKTTVKDRRYLYHIAAYNGSGKSTPEPETSPVYTTPLPVTNVKVVRSGSNSTVTWTNNAHFGEYIEVWHAANGVWDGSALSTSVSPTATSYTHTGPSQATTHTYKIKVKRGSLYAPDAVSNVLGIVAPPLAPTLELDSNLYFIFGDDELRWPSGVGTADEYAVFKVDHNAVDGTTMTGYQIQHRLIGAGSWTSTVSASSTGTNSVQYTQNMGSIVANGSTYEFQARTKGLNASYGPWSPSLIKKFSARPTVTYVSPVSVFPLTTTYASSTLVVEWSYFDAEGTPQSAFELELFENLDPSNVWDNKDIGVYKVSGSASSFTVPVTLKNNQMYLIGLRMFDGDGMDGASEYLSIETDFPLPPLASATTTFIEDEGTTQLQLTVAEPAGAEVDPVAIQVYRLSGEEMILVADNLSAVEDSVTAFDFIPPLNTTVEYVVRTLTDTGTYADSEPFSVDTHTPWVFINGGAGWQTRARLKGNPSVDLSVNREKVLHQFAGRTKPVEFIGNSQNRVYKVSGDVDGFGTNAELGTWSSFEEVSSLPAPLVYRDPIGRRVFGSIDEVSIKHSAKSKYAGVDFTITEVDYDE